jgi:serine/threonine protein kinase
MQTISDFERIHDKIISDKEEKDDKYGCCEEDYMIIQLLGKGAFGSVYKVKAKNSKTYVLKKIPIADLTTRKQQMATLNEVKLLQSIKHQHIIRVYHSFIDNYYFYILMEYASVGIYISEFRCI